MAGDDDPTLPPPDSDDEPTLAPPDAEDPTLAPEDAETQFGVESETAFHPAPATPPPEGLDVWAKTLAANPDTDDPGLTYKPNASTVADTRERPTLSPRASILKTETPVDPDAFDYRITETLGRGGMGEIHGAVQRVLQRHVALKTLLPHLRNRGSAEQRFVAEALITGRLQHPNIVPVHDLGRTREGDLFMGMKLVRGETLSDVLKREPPTDTKSLRRMLDVFQRICDAMAYAHDQGVLHRDLKPSNVMVGEFGEVQVMDWGLATEADPARRDEEDGPCGTPSYMSPEQASGESERVGPPADVYLLGAMLYEVLTGKPPHRGSTLHEVLFAALQGKVTPPSERAPERSIPFDLEELCMRALEPEPEQRLQTVREFRAGIDRHLAHAEAIGLIERASDLLEADAEARTPHEKAEELSRAKLLLQQAQEMWPESDEVQELLARVTVAQVDVALDRGEARAASELAASLEGSAGVPPERVQALQKAARRQRTRWRNQVIMSVVLAVVTLGGYGLWQETMAPGLNRRAQIADARAVSARTTAEVWKELLTSAPPSEVGEKVKELRRVLIDAEWPDGDDGGDLHNVALARGWRALRDDNPPRAARLIDQRFLREDGTLRENLEQSLTEKGAEGMLLEALQGEPTRTPLGCLQDTVRLLYPLSHLTPEALERYAPRVRERLTQLGSRGALLGVDSGLRRDLLFAPDEQAVRLRLLRERETKESGKTRYRDVVQAVDADDGRELWRFPPPGVQLWEPSHRLQLPLVLPSKDGLLAFFVLDDELHGVDLVSGRMKRRLSLLSIPVGVVPTGPGELGALVGAGRHGRGRSLMVRATPDGGWRTQPPASEFPLRYSKRELNRLHPSSDERPKDDPQRLREELERLDAFAARDATNPFLPAARGTRLLQLGREAEALEALEPLLQSDLHPFELCMLANTLDEKAGQRDFADRLAQRAVARHVARRTNADVRPLLMGNPALFLRLMAKRALDAKDTERGLELLALSRQVATTLEMDKHFLPSELRWLRENGLEEQARLLERDYQLRAERMGGAFMMPDVILGIDFAFLALGVLPILLVLTVLVIACRTNAARTAGLRALGFRTLSARWAAFLTHPGVRLSHTFVAYANRRERMLLIVGTLVLLGSYVYQNAIIRRIAIVAAIPVQLGSGEFDHPMASEFVIAARDAARSAGKNTIPHERVLTEADLRAGREAEARVRLERLLSADPSDPFANVNLGALLEREGDASGAAERYRRAASVAGELGAVGRYNLARLEGGERPPLPPPYAAWLEHGDTEQPLRQFIAQTDLMAVLGVSTSRAELFRDELVLFLSSADVLKRFDELTRSSTADFFNAGETEMSGAFAFGARMRLPLLLLGLFALFHLPFPGRSREPGPSEGARRWLERLGQLGNLLLPGLLWLARGRVIIGFLTALAAPVSALLVIVSGSMGSILYGITMMNSDFHVGVESTDDLFASPTMALVGLLAKLTLVVIYGLALIQAGRSVRAWWRARRA